MSRDPRPLADHALERELEALLAVEPSTGFARRAYASAVAEGSRPRVRLAVARWLLVPAGVAAALVVALLLSKEPPAPVAPTSTSAPRVQSPPVMATAPARPDAAVERPAVPGPRRASASRASREIAVARRVPAPEVLISAEEARGLATMIARAEPLRMRLVGVGGATHATPSTEPDPLFVEPLVINPVSAGDLSEGVWP